jgi:two-component system, OmpR family, alkaline phosphatase synthesis response regulator PhoP
VGILMKVLVVEDSKFLRLATERALSRAGYDVSTAIDGDQALQTAQEELPDLILLDMLLPKMTGLDVLHALKKDQKTADIPVVVCTGLSQKNAERMQTDGAFAFLEKSELGLERGPDALLAALQEIVKQIPAKRKQSANAASAPK